MDDAGQSLNHYSIDIDVEAFAVAVFVAIGSHNRVCYNQNQCSSRCARIGVAADCDDDVCLLDLAVTAVAVVVAVAVENWT